MFQRSWAILFCSGVSSPGEMPHAADTLWCFIYMLSRHTFPEAPNTTRPGNLPEMSHHLPDCCLFLGPFPRKKHDQKQTAADGMPLWGFSAALNAEPGSEGSIPAKSASTEAWWYTVLHTWKAYDMAVTLPQPLSLLAIQTISFCLVQLHPPSVQYHNI